MPSVVIIPENQRDVNSFVNIRSNFSGWEIHVLPPRAAAVASIKSIFREKELHFLVYAKRINKDSLQELKTLHKVFPQVTIVYYCPYLNYCQFLYLYDCGVSSCVVGEEEPHKLMNRLGHLWRCHWKQIPDSFLAVPRDELSCRAGKVLTYIETYQLKHYNSASLAKFLGISKSHFRTEFRQEFGYSFREFKRKLFKHYESVLLFEYHLKPNEIYKYLNYRYLSGYSRAFKVRHGQPWRSRLSVY